MKFLYGCTQIIEKCIECRLTVYQYWIILAGNGCLECDNHKIHFYAHEILEIPEGAIIMMHSETKVMIGILELTDFVATNTKIRHYQAHQSELARKAFLFGLELSGIEHPYKARMQRYADQIMADILLTMPHLLVVETPVLQRVLHDINEGYMNPEFRISDVLKEKDYSPAYIRRLFQEETGTTPTVYVTNRRIEKAKALLRERNRDKSVKEIAEESGFSDAYYFSRVFKKMTGQTPMEYRKNRYNERE